MARMINRGEAGDDMPMQECDSCSTTFGIMWNYDGFTSGISYCPFCGEEVEEDDDEE